MIDKAKQILKSQKKHFVLIVGCSLLGVLAISHFLLRDIGPSPSKLSISPKVDLPVDKINPQDIWMNRQDSVIGRMDSENKLLDQKMKYLEDLILTGKKKEEENDKEKLELKKMVLLLQKDLKTVSENPKPPIKDQEIAFNSPSSSENLSSKAIKADPFSSFSPPPYFHEPFTPSSYLGKNSVESPSRPNLREYAMQTEENTAISVDEVVPAAVSVKALLVSSVDAVCGVYANSDPVPVKLRLLDDAHLPKGVTVKLKGCLLIASAYGNISNERVYMRLERLTHVSPQGEAIETEVVGYVSGEDGKFGVQGTVIDRSVKIVKNAAASGFLGGIGQVLQASVSHHPVDCWNTYSVGSDAAARGAASGASSAFDMLAEYYIRRAEQVQPVLQVNAGRIVDITFTHGFAMGDLTTKEKIKSIRCRHRGR